MNEEEKNAIEKIEDTFYSDLGKGINKFQKITLYEDSIRDVRILLNLIEKLQKENEEKTTIILAGAEKVKQVEKENKTLKNFTSSIFNGDIEKNYIPVQKVKDKIRKNEEIIDISNDGDLIHELLQKNKVYEELLESEK